MINPFLLVAILDIIADHKLLEWCVGVLQGSEYPIVVLILCQNLLGSLEWVPLLIDIDTMLLERDVKLTDDDLIIIELKIFLESVVSIFIENLNGLAPIVPSHHRLLFVLDHMNEIAKALAYAHFLELKLHFHGLVVLWLFDASREKDCSRLRQGTSLFDVLGVTSWRLDLFSKLIDLVLDAFHALLLLRTGRVSARRILLLFFISNVQLSGSSNFERLLVHNLLHGLPCALEV